MLTNSFIQEIDINFISREFWKNPEKQNLMATFVASVKILQIHFSKVTYSQINNHPITSQKQFISQTKATKTITKFNKIKILK